VLLADEVEHREAALAGVGREPQAPAELLQEHKSAWGAALGPPLPGKMTPLHFDYFNHQGA